MTEPAPRRASAPDAFWRFSLALYARPDVAHALLTMQDSAGDDVNLILFTLWGGLVVGARLDTATMAAIEADTAALRGQFVAPLRAFRRRLTLPDHDIKALRPVITGLELAAERRVQYRLADLAPSPAAGENRPALAQANLATYLGERIASPQAALILQAALTLARSAREPTP